ncbi:MAG: hypothetical protein ACFB9M_07500 [Myxococcota bacterium]
MDAPLERGFKRERPSILPPVHGPLTVRVFSVRRYETRWLTPGRSTLVRR